MTISLTATVDALAPAAAHASAGDLSATITTDLTAVDDAIAAAAANATISGDPTAAGLVQAIQDAFDTLDTDVGGVDLSASITGDVIVTFDPSTVLTKNMLRACLNAIVRAVDGSDDLT